MLYFAVESVDSPLLAKAIFVAWANFIADVAYAKYLFDYLCIHFAV